MRLPVLMFLLLSPVSGQNSDIGRANGRTLLNVTTEHGAVSSSSVNTNSTKLTQDPGFIHVQGNDLRSRVSSAITLANSNPSTKRFWVGYSFRVRPGVAVDTEVINNEGKKILLKGVNVSLDPPFDTRNLG